jgi:hypothetical protein
LPTQAARYGAKRFLYYFFPLLLKLKTFTKQRKLITSQS